MKIKSSSTIFSILMMLLLSSCLPVSKETTCADNEAYDAEQRKCVPTIANGPNTVFIVNPTPLNSVYTTNLSASVITHAISVSNQYNIPISIKWKLYNGAISTEVSLGSNYTLAPSTLANPGNYILEAGVYNENGTTLYDSKTWTITVEAIATPTLTNNSPSINVITYASNVTSAIHSLDINNPGGLSGQYRTLIDGVLFNGLQTFNSGTSTISSTLNPSTLGMGLHSVEVQLLKTGTQIEYDSFVWTLNVIEPDLPKIQLATSTPSLYNPISAINGIAFQPSTSGTASASGIRDINNNAINKFCIAVDDADKDNDGNSDIRLIFEINGTQQGVPGTFLQNLTSATTANPNNNTYCHSDFTVAPLINPDISESRTLLIKSINVATGSVIETVQYDLKVRPKNLRPLISIDNSTNPNAVPCTTINSSVLYTACEMTQSSDVALNGNYTDAEDTNNSKEFAIKFLTESDPDITSDAQFNVFYEIKSTNPIFQNLDGTSTLSKTNCTTSVPKTKCAIDIDAFGTTGNLPPGSYTVQAYIADTGSVWDPGNPKESNRVSWQVDVKELQTAGSISIGAQSAANATPIAANESWLENTGASCTSTNTVVNATNAITENDFITVHTLVKDRERDNFNLSMTISNGLGGGVTPIVGTTNIIRSNNSEFIEVINCFKVPEYVTSGAASSLATLNVSVTDVPDTVGLPAQFASQSLSLLVNNYNPNPTFSDNSDVNLNLLSSFAGLPFNLSAPTFNDLNTTDGNQISYKWQVSADNATWLDIPNANSTDQSNASLIWTAAPTLTGTVSFRLCLGDNGFGNPADCSQVTATKRYTNLNIISSQQSTAPSALISANDKRNLSSWLDKTNNNLYTTYSIGTNIYVNKKSTNTNGELVNEHTISFPLESDAQSPLISSSQPANLSIDGIDGNTLMVAYNVLKTTPAGKFLRVRRIDISYGKLSFKYGGFYNGELIDTPGLAGYDQVSSITNSGLTITTTGSDNGEMNIQVTAVNNGDRFTITTPSGTAITLTVGNGIGELCQTTACPTPQNLAANIETFINNHANPEISKELLAVHVTSSDTVLIKGSNSYDFHDGISSMPYIGNISLKAGIGWAIPYVDTTTNSQLAIYRYTSATTNQNGTSPSFIKITTGGNLKSLKGLFSDSNYIVTAINNNNNMDIYKLTNAFASAPLATINDAFNLGTFLVDEYDFDIGSDGTNQYIYVASKLKSNSSTDTKLAAIMSQMDLTSYVATDTFNITHNLTANIDEIKISASQVTKGNATLGIITSAVNSSANNLHIAKLTHPMNVGTYASSINFEISNDTNYNSPAVNASSIESTSTMSLTQSFTATRGYMSESSTPGTPDLSREVFYVNFMSTDPVTAGNTLLNLNMINTQKESVMSNSAAGLLSYPSFLKN